MAHNNDLLISMRCIVKAYSAVMKTVCERFGLTLLEAKVVTFLHNNPERNTAGDIAEYRMLSKSNVSQAVEGLICKGLLERSADPADRRRVILTLLPAASPVTERIDVEWNAFCRLLYRGFSQEEASLYENFHQRMTKNAREIMALRGKGEELE